MQCRICPPEPAERGVNGKSCVRLSIWDLSCVWSRALLPVVGFVLLTSWIHPDQTCQGKNWFYFKSHYSFSAFHHPADTLFAAASLLAAGGTAVKAFTAGGKGKVLPSNTQDSHRHLYFSLPWSANITAAILGVKQPNLVLTVHSRVFLAS